MKQIKLRENKWKIGYLIIFIFFLIMNVFVPIGGDDWEISSWYNTPGLINLFGKSVFAWIGFNGRIIHNFMTMFLDNYGILWIITSAAVYTLTIYILLKFFKLEKNHYAQLLMLLLFLMVPLNFRMEVQFHRNANIPYSFGTLNVFYLLYLINNHINNDNSGGVEHSKDWLSYLGIFLLALCSALWIENITIASFLIISLLFIKNIVKNKKIDKYTAFALLGSFIGSVILFSSPGFWNRYNNTTGGNSFIYLLKNNIPLLLESITFSMKEVYLLFSIISIIVLWKKSKKNLSDIILQIYFIFLNVLIIGYIFLYNFSHGSTFLMELSSKYNFIFFNSHHLISLLIMISMLLSLLIMIYKMFGNMKNNGIILYLLSLFSMIPMILSPGYRNYILCIYSIFIIIVNIFSILNIQEQSKNFKKLFSIILGLLLFIRVEAYVNILSDAYNVTTIRKQIIFDYKLKQIKNFGYFEDYLILPTYDKNFIDNLNSNYYTNSITNYYGLNKNTKILFDDGFIYQTIIINKKDNSFEINIKALSKDIDRYHLKIYKQGKLIFDQEKNNSIFEFNFQQNGEYLLNCTIYNNKGDYLIKNEYFTK